MDSSIVQNKKILIVDDDAGFRDFVIIVLSDNGYVCFQAGDVNEAQQILKSETVDLCLLDLIMPERSGDDFLKEIKLIYPDIGVIISTGVGSLDAAAKCHDLGADDYLLKPFEPQRLLISLKNVSERRRLLLDKKFYRMQLEKKLAEQEAKLKLSQSILVQQEKLAAIGQLAAGVAHEINNPVGFISGNLRALSKYADKILVFKDAVGQLLDSPIINQTEMEEIRQQKQKLDDIFDDLHELVSESLEGTDKIKEIVQSLKSFTRMDSEKSVPVDINACLDDAITVVWNEIKYNSQLEKEFAELPHIQGFPQQLAQVFMNLLVNASHAIVTKGVIKIKTLSEPHLIRVIVTDNGCGIAPENLNRIFDPFFTTKAVGKGTGLGMSISSDIIHKHNGSISVCSEVGQGTTFTLEFPLDNED
jgi:signal transduction histidine kinase